MPIAPDPNIPTQPGYLQVVSFHLLSRDGEKIDLEDGTFVVRNITDLDAHLALVPDLGREESPDEDARLQLARAIALIRHDKNAAGNEYRTWTQYNVAADGESQTRTDNVRDAEHWQSFAYTGELNPTAERPCFIGEESNRYLSFVTQYQPPDTFGLGDDPPGTKIELSDSQDTALFASDNPITIPASVWPVDSNAEACTLGAEIFTDFEIVGWQFNPAEYPKEDATSPDPKIKLLWLAGTMENT